MRLEKHIPFILLLLLFPFTGMTQSGNYDFTADVIQGCDSITVQFSFINNTGTDTISEFAWDFGNGEVSYDRDPAPITFNTPGTYTIILFYGSSPDNLLANDPIIKNNYINVYPTITSGFAFSDTSELGYYTISFRHNYHPNAIAGIYSWDFDDGTVYSGTGSDYRSPIHQFPGPGTYNVSLNVSTTLGCADSTVRAITLTVPPGLPDIIPSETFACGVARVKFTLGNVDTDTISSIQWNFGNQTTSTDPDPDTVIYNQPGFYDVGVLINGDLNHGVVEENLIHVQLISPADFTYTDTVTYDTYILTHTGETDALATYSYLWDISGVGTRTEARELIKFPVADTSYVIRLTVSDNYGCSSSSEVTLFIFEELQVQNVFTPNNDGINDLFEINSQGSIPLSIHIFTRTGTLVYKGEGSMITWDGKTTWGLEVMEGVYYYVLDALENDPNGRFHKTGFIYLYR